MLLVYRVWRERGGHLCSLLSDRNKILNDEQRRQQNNPQIKIDNAENSLFPKNNEMYNDE